MAISQYIDFDNVNVSAGKAAKYSHINKFGYNTAVGGSYETITDLGSAYYPTTASTVVLTSSDTEDDEDKGGGVAGTGAHTVEVQGLDENYKLITETLITNGTSTRTSTNTFTRIFRMKVTSAGTSGTNEGTITLTHGGNNIARIAAEEGQTLMAVYTVPKGKKAYLFKFQGSISKNQEANFQLRTRTVDDGAWQTKGLWGTFAAAVNYDYPFPLEFPEKTDIEIRGKAGATSEMGAIFDLLIVG